MIDPTKITNYNLNDKELELHILFWSFAAGHNAKSTARGIDRFLRSIGWNPQHSPFKTINAFLGRGGELPEQLRRSGLGCWRIKSRTVRELVSGNLNFKTCGVEDLEGIYGIGPKTARGFILHTRRNAKVACLDTHLLKFLREKGVDAPKSTPPAGPKYRRLEQEFLRLCVEAGKTPAEYDLAIWRKYSGRKESIAHHP